MKSLRSYLERLDILIPNQLLRVKEAVDWQYEITSAINEMSKRDDNPALFFERVKDYSMPLVINLFGHVDRINLALEGSSHQLGNRLDFYKEWNSLFNKEVPPIYVDNGPIRDNRYVGNDVDLASLPIQKFYEQDAGRYITSGLLVARDPDNYNVINLSYARMQLKGRDKLGVSLHSRGNMWHYFERSKAADKPLDVAIIIGAHPAIYLAAAAKITNEYSIAGALLGEPVELVTSETLDLPVPAQSEIVLEGQILLDEEDEGPFSEYTGYLSGRSTRNVIHVLSIAKRSDAIYLSIAPSNSAEHLLLSGLPKQARIYKSMTDFMPMPALKDLYWPVSGTHFVCFISLEKSRGSIRGLAKQIGLLLLGLDPYVKIVTIFTEETDVSDTIGSLETVASRCDFKIGSCVEILRGIFTHRLDPSSTEEGVSSKMIIDAMGPEIEVEPSQSGLDTTYGSGSLNVEEVFFPRRDNPRFCVIKVKPNFEDLKGFLYEESLKGCRLIVCVDEDIDIQDDRQVLWALATRFQPANDAIMMDGRMEIDAIKRRTWKAIRASIPSQMRKSPVHR
jgi:UbiD family decarboxylase